jgi:iron complex transport system ATP-binding protein
VLLRADNVSFAYRGSPKQGAASTAPVIDGVSMEVRRGRIVGILGPNGSGKTTLLRLLSGSRQPTGGDVLLDGESLRRLPRKAAAQRIAVVPQETHLAYEYSVIEIVLMGRHPHLGLFELEGPHDVDVARQALRATGTEQLERRQFHTLSGGEKQRVVIASALAQSAEVLLLDEPTASLDLGYQLEIATLLRTLNRQQQVTIGISTHDLNLAAAICDDIVLLDQGRVLAAGTTADVLTPAHLRQLYGVTADVQFHAQSGHLVVVPISRTERAHP